MIVVHRTRPRLLRDILGYLRMTDIGVVGVAGIGMMPLSPNWFCRVVFGRTLLFRLQAGVPLVRRYCFRISHPSSTPDP